MSDHANKQLTASIRRTVMMGDGAKAGFADAMATRLMSLEEGNAQGPFWEWLAAGLPAPGAPLRRWDPIPKPDPDK